MSDITILRIEITEDVLMSCFLFDVTVKHEQSGKKYFCRMKITKELTNDDEFNLWKHIKDIARSTYEALISSEKTMV